MIQFLLSPVLLSVAGWPFCWYLYAGLGGAWCLFWLRAAADTPKDHPRISQRELDWINDIGVRRGSWLEANNKSWWPGASLEWSLGSSIYRSSIEPIDSSDFSCRIFCRIVSHVVLHLRRFSVENAEFA